MSDEVPPPPRPSEGLPDAELQARQAKLDELADVYSMQVQLRGLFVPTDKTMPVGSILTLQARTGDGSDAPSVRLLTRVAEKVPADDPRGQGLQLELLELQPQNASRMSFEPAPQSMPAPPGAHVLVVDDEPLAREETALMMREAGYRVTTARNGVEALSIVLGDDDPIDLILTDLNMPTMDGWQLLRLVRSRTKVRHIPVVFLTRLTSDDERLKGYELGVSDYIEKPVSREQLQTAVVKQLAVAQASRASGPPVLRGDLGQVALGSLLSLLELERRSGRLQVDHRGERAVLWLREGVVVRVDLLAPRDIEAGLPRLLYVLDWEGGDFALSAEQYAGEAQLDIRTTHVLLEHARQRDEGDA